MRVFADGNFLAIGSHDNCIYIYGVSDNGRKYTRVGKCSVSARVTPRGSLRSFDTSGQHGWEPVRRVRLTQSSFSQGHSSFITHLDWSVNSQFLMSNSGDYEILYCEWLPRPGPGADLPELHSDSTRGLLQKPTACPHFSASIPPLLGRGDRLDKPLLGTEILGGRAPRRGRPGPAGRGTETGQSCASKRARACGGITLPSWHHEVSPAGWSAAPGALPSQPSQSPGGAGPPAGGER